MEFFIKRVGVETFSIFQLLFFKPSPSSPDVDWLLVLRGCCLSMGQVYAVESIVTSIIMWTALILYNPVLALLSAVGAGLGTLLPLNFLGIVNPHLNIIGVFFVFRCFRL